MVSITRTAAQVLASHRITSNAICPGAVDTPLWAKLDAKWTALDGWKPEGRPGGDGPLASPSAGPAAEDLTGLAVFLASADYSDYMTGQAVTLDGGVRGS